MSQKYGEPDLILLKLQKPVRNHITKVNRQSINTTLEDQINEDELVIIKKMLAEILKTSETIQLDVDFIKSRYTKSTTPVKKRISREQQISELKHKILTRGKKKI